MQEVKTLQDELNALTASGPTDPQRCPRMLPAIKAYHIEPFDPDKTDIIKTSEGDFMLDIVGSIAMEIPDQRGVCRVFYCSPIHNENCGCF